MSYCAEEKVAGAQARQTFRVGKLNLVDLAGSERVRNPTRFAVC